MLTMLFHYLDMEPMEKKILLLVVSNAIHQKVIRYRSLNGTRKGGGTWGCILRIYAYGLRRIGGSGR